MVGRFEMVCNESEEGGREMIKWEFLTLMFGFGCSFVGGMGFLYRWFEDQKLRASEIVVFAVGIALLCVWASI